MINQESIQEMPPIVVRKSVVLFLLRVISNEVIFEAIYLTWRGVIHFLPLSLETVITLNVVSIVFFLILVTVLQTGILVFITLRWVNEYYEIRPDEIAHITGILSKIQKAYPYRDIQSITIHQGFFGKLFNYGSVHLYIPTLGHDLEFNEITNPVKFVELVKSTNPKTESGKYLFRR